MASSPRYRDQIDWRDPVQYIVDHFGQTVTAGGATFRGFNIVPEPTATPGDHRVAGAAGIAWEFTGQMVALMQFVDALYSDTPFGSLAADYLAQIRMAQTSAPFGDGAGVVAATVNGGDLLAPVDQGLTTPFQFIPERVSLPATVWAILADLNVNPFAQLPVVPPPAPTPALVFSTEPMDVAAGGKFQVVVHLQDETGATVTDGRPKVQISLSDGPVAGKLIGKSTVVAKNGVATFSRLALPASGQYSLQATTAGFAAATSNTFAVVPAAPAKLTFVSEPPATLALNDVFGVQLQLLDKYGNLVSSAPSSAVLELAVPASDAILHGSLSANVVDGLAQFDDLFVSAAGSYRIKAAYDRFKASSIRFRVN
jgi:hypothetical protein